MSAVAAGDFSTAEVTFIQDPNDYNPFSATIPCIVNNVISGVYISGDDSPITLIVPLYKGKLILAGFGESHDYGAAANILIENDITAVTGNITSSLDFDNYTGELSVEGNGSITLGSPK